MTLNSRFVFFSSMLGFVLFSRGLPISAFVPIGLICVVSGKRYGLYATLVWFVLTVPTIWASQLGAMQVISSLFLGLVSQNLARLPTYAQQSVAAEPAIQNAISAFSGSMPYIYAALATVSTIPAMLALGWGFFFLRPKIRARILQIARQSEKALQPYNQTLPSQRRQQDGDAHLSPKEAVTEKPVRRAGKAVLSYRGRIPCAKRTLSGLAVWVNSREGPGQGGSQAKIP